MRLLLCVHHALDPNAGAPGATLALGDELMRLGHSVAYLSHDDLPPRMPQLAKELLFPELAALALRRRAGSFDIVDASTGDAWLWARMRPEASPALISRSHGLEHRFWSEQVTEAHAAGRRIPLRTRLYHGRWRLREVAASLRASDACVFLNASDRAYAIERLGVEPARAHVVANGIPRAFLDAPVPEDAAGTGIGIAHIGSWTERKGHRFLAAALGGVMASHPGVRVSLLGTGAPDDVVTAAFPEDMRRRVTTVSAYDHDSLLGLLAGQQIVVSTSLAEGFSLALPEAMACGLAPVATAVGGAPDLIEDGVNGLLVPPRDAHALEAAVAGLLDSAETLGALRRAARATAERYSWEAIARDNLEVYEAARERSASAMS